MKYLSLAFLFFLTACSTSPTIPTEVKIPVAVPCKITPPSKPTFEVDNLALGSDIFTQVKSLLADRKQRQGYEAELEASIKECQ